MFNIQAIEVISLNYAWLNTIWNYLWLSLISSEKIKTKIFIILSTFYHPFLLYLFIRENETQFALPAVKTNSYEIIRDKSISLSCDIYFSKNWGPRSGSKPGNETVTEDRANDVYWFSGWAGRQFSLLKPHTPDKHRFFIVIQAKKKLLMISVLFTVTAFPISVNKKVRTNDGTFTNSTPDRHFWVMPWFCMQFSCIFKSSVTTVLLIHYAIVIK